MIENRRTAEPVDSRARRAARLAALAVLVILTPTAGQDAGEAWFPEGTFASPDVAASFVPALEAMYERPIRAGGDFQQSYRFLWLRAFHDPVMVRLDVTPAGEGQVTTKVLRGGRGGSGGQMELVRSEWVNDRKVRSFRRDLDRQGFWSLAASGTARGLDGSLWMIEALDGRRYHAVERWSPADGPVRELGELMLRLGDAPRRPLY